MLENEVILKAYDRHPRHLFKLEQIDNIQDVYYENEYGKEPADNSKEEIRISCWRQDG